MYTRLSIVAVGLVLAIAAPAAQSDLDALMEHVLSRRDENWKKLQQYTLNEDETIQLTGPGGARLYGREREFLWFPRAGFFIRSPLRADGVDVPEHERRRAEDRFLQRARTREQRQPSPSARAGRPADERASPADDVVAGGGVEDIIRQSFEPQFISSANFLRFKFDPGHYALVGRERLMERNVLKIEYYPSRLFEEGRTRPNRELRRDDERIQGRMNKTSFVTLWVDPAVSQILQYEFHNVGLDFLPARHLVRVDEMTASMRMGQPFPDVWLPASIDMTFRMTLAVGEVSGRYRVVYHDYRLPETSGRVR